MDIRLTSWTQSIEYYDGASPVHKVLEFIGADPLVVRLPKGVRVLIQSGEAIGDTLRPKPAAPVIESPIFLEKIKIVFGPDEFLALKTSWTYVMIWDSEEDPTAEQVIAWEADPETPEFYEVE